MSMQTDLTRIKNAKAAIKAYIEGKGLTVPDATLLDGMASMLESIEAGGENQLVYGTYTPASDQTAAYGGSFSVEFGFVPDVFVMYPLKSTLDRRKNSAVTIIDRPEAHKGDKNNTLFNSIATAPNSTAAIGTSNHRYYGTHNIMTETNVKFFGPSGSLLVGGVEYFWIAVKFT